MIMMQCIKRSVQKEKEIIMATRIIRRYQNRKLYDPETSKTVTLAELADLIRKGEDIKVLDNEENDITARILAKIFVQEDLTAKGTILKKVLLEGLIYEGGDKMGTLLKKVMLAGVGLGRLTQEKIEAIVDELIKKGELAEDERSKFVKEVFTKLEQKGQDLRHKVEEVTEKLPLLGETEGKGKGKNREAELNDRIESLTKQLQDLKAEKAHHETSNEKQLDSNKEKEPVGGKRKNG